MQTQESIELLFQNDLYGLCTNCAKATHCSYLAATEKIIIQCQLYEFNQDNIVSEVEYVQTKGLCMNCAKADFCHLPNRVVGVWHCEEYL